MEEKTISFHTNSTRIPGGYMQIEEHIRYLHLVPYQIYEITKALETMNEDEIIKVMKNIMTITNNRIKFELPSE